MCHARESRIGTSMANAKIYQVDEPFLRTSCSLGEGPYYDASSGILRFLDIENHEVHTVDMSQGATSHKVLATLDAPIGCTANIAGRPDEILFAGGRGFGILHAKTGRSQVFHDYWTEAETQQPKYRDQRGNDGKVSPEGRFFAGTMVDPRIRPGFPAEGVLFRVDHDLSVHRVKEGVAIPNGMSWTADTKTMYWTDSKTGEVEKYDYDAKSGEVSNRRTFWKCPGPGVPDGHAQDVDGHLWIAIAGGSKVVRVSPEGAVVAVIHLPTRLVTCAAFVDEDLLITTGAEPEPKEHPESATHAGE